MTVSRPLQLALLLGLAWQTAHAESYTPAYSRCLDESGGTTVAMLDCIAQELPLQDRRLNAAYRALGARLPPTRMQQLRSAQRLWLQYRDANCAFHADPEGGTLATISANECVLRETAGRADELESFAEPE